MWNIGVGLIELTVCLSLVAAVVFSRGTARRWLGVVLAIMVLTIFLTPPDPLSALLVAAPLTFAFTLGVCAAPFLRPLDSVARQ